MKMVRNEKEKGENLKTLLRKKLGEKFEEFMKDLRNLIDGGAKEEEIIEALHKKYSVTTSEVRSHLFVG